MDSAGGAIATTEAEVVLGVECQEDITFLSNSWGGELWIHSIKSTFYVEASSTCLIAQIKFAGVKMYIHILPRYD